MPTLYVTEPGAVVRKQQNSLIVTLTEDKKSGKVGTRKKILLEVEPHRLELIALIGRVHMTSEVTAFCLREGIAISWLTRSGDFLGRLVPELSRTADIRLHQFKIAVSNKDSLAISRSIIHAKMKNTESFLAAIRSNRSKQKAFSLVISHIQKMLSEVKSVRKLDTLLGLEGEVARQYFTVYGKAFTGPLKFQSRKRRPPPDPVNALLSFGYVLLGNMLASLLESRGFDPYVGFLHSVRSGRPSLALDILEEFRQSVVDRFVLNTCNRKQLKLDDFQIHSKQGCRLTKDGMRKFFQNWEEYLNSRMAGADEDLSVENILKRQVDRMADHVRGKTEYKPFVLSGD